MRQQRGYQSYRGRASKKKVALVIVLLLVLLLSAAYLFLQNRAVYHSDGSVTWDIPFFGKEEEDTGEDDGEKLPVEILPGDEDGETGENTGTEPVKETAPTVTEIPLTELTAEKLASLSGNDGFITEVKGFNGTYYYASQYATSQATDASAVSQTEVKAALSAKGELLAIAKVGCFHDSFHAYRDMTGSGICQSSGHIWYDNLRSHWMDPFKEGTKTYLAGVVRECLDMGFDEILLTDFGYPAEGDLSGMDLSYLTGTKTDALTGFLAYLGEQMGEHGKLSVSLSQSEVLESVNETTGVSVEAIAPYVHRFVVTGVDDSEAVSKILFEKAGEEVAGRSILLP